MAGSIYLEIISRSDSAFFANIIYYNTSFLIYIAVFLIRAVGYYGGDAQGLAMGATLKNVRPCTFLSFEFRR